MPASSKKSPLTTTKKKKAAPAPVKSKKNGGNKKAKDKDLVSSKADSYLNDEFPSITAFTDILPQSVAASSVSVDHTVFNILSQLEQSNSELMRRM